MEKVKEEQDPDQDKVFYTSVPSVSPELNDKQIETTNAARKIAEIAVIRSLEEITPLLIQNDDYASIPTHTMKDAFDYMDRKRPEGQEPKKEPEVGILIEIDDECERDNSDCWKTKEEQKHSNTQSDEKKIDEKSKNVDETSKNADETLKKVDETLNNVDETSKNADETSKNVDETSKKIDEPSKKIDETSKKLDETLNNVDETSKKVDESSKFPAKIELRDKMDGFTRLTTIPEIIIGEIDKQEATLLYEQLLGVGKNFLDWLNVNYNFRLNSLSLPTAIIQDFHLQQPDTSNTEQTKVLQKQILSIEAEYNKLKREGNSTIATKIDSSSYNKGQALCKHGEEIKPEPEHIGHIMYSPQAQQMENIRQEWNNMNQTDRPRLFHPYSDQESNRCTVNSTHENGPVCPCHIEKRLVKLEQSLKNHGGDFTNVIAELRACLDYCNSEQLQNHDVNAVIRARIAKLTDIVELHRKALEDWKVELSKPRIKMISKK